MPQSPANFIPRIGLQDQLPSPTVKYRSGQKADAGVLQDRARPDRRGRLSHLIELETILREGGAQMPVPAAAWTRHSRSRATATWIAALARSQTRAGTHRAGCLLPGAARRPFAFYTGQTETDPIRAQWPDCEIVAKPAAPKAIVAAVAGLLRGGGASEARS